MKLFPTMLDLASPPPCCSPPWAGRQLLQTYDLMWDKFRTTYGKVYNGITDESTRFEIFKGHVDFICSTNARNLSFSLKVTEFADLQNSEFVS